MKIKRQLEIVIEEIELLLLSGNNFTIFIDIKRSQITYFKYLANKDLVRINLREREKGENES